MDETPVTHSSSPVLSTQRGVAGPDAVLESLRALNEQHIAREQSMVLLAVEWARMNPEQNPGPEHDRFRGEAGLEWAELADRGCLHVDELTMPAFASAAGLSEYQANRLMRESLLLVHFLPRVWHRASQGQVQVWRARKLAAECQDLTPEALDYVDQHMSTSTARHTLGGREEVIKAAKLAHMPRTAEEEEQQAACRRAVIFDFSDASHGTVEMWASMDLLDAKALMAALQEETATIGKYSDASYEVRQSWALGNLARNVLGEARGQAPQLNFYLHLTPEAIWAGDGTPGTGTPSPNTGIRVTGSGIPDGMVLTPDRVRQWFDRPWGGAGPKITFRPVIDLHEHEDSPGYEVPDRIKERVGLRDHRCVFPWCNRKAVRTDCDHTIPWKENGTGGPTCSCNLAPLCRKHHRAKTHADNHVGNAYTWWDYEPMGHEGAFLWRGPKGTMLVRTNDGVYDVSQENLTHGPRLPEQRAVGRTVSDTFAETLHHKDADHRRKEAQRVVKTIQKELPPPPSSPLTQPPPLFPSEDDEPSESLQPPPF